MGKRRSSKQHGKRSRRKIHPLDKPKPEEMTSVPVRADKSAVHPLDLMLTRNMAYSV